jgi:hypothetical protein
MQSVVGQIQSGKSSTRRVSSSLAFLIGSGILGLAANGIGQEVSTNAPAFNASPTDPVLGLLLEKGMITEQEAAKVQAQADAMRTNEISELRESDSQWKISKAVKNMEFFGDVRLRYENRTAKDPNGGTIELNRLRFSVRVGLRGELFDDFYYGVRVETAANPRSPWVTFGSSASSGSSASPYQGPFGKSNSTLAIGQAYLGWRPEPWFDITLGQMPNPLYTTPMIWDSDLDPMGAAEHFKYQVGEADFFANFGQFLYADTNPTQTAPGYFNPLTTSSGSLPFLLAWQGGFDYHFTKQVDFKIAATLYNYTAYNNGLPLPVNPTYATSPGFSGTYVGQGGTQSQLSSTSKGSYNQNNNGGSTAFDGFYSNETGINDLLVLEIPFELNIKMAKLDYRVFGDYAQNLDGNQRAQAAYNASLSPYFSGTGAGAGLIPISSPQTHDDKAYQIGLAIANKDAMGLVYGTNSRKNGWEFRTYWQHVEQYSLDPNLIDSDYFEGAENLQGAYAAIAYGFTDNLVGTFRYGYASRINNKLGTGSSNQDIPQMNPINQYQVLQFDLSCQF